MSDKPTELEALIEQGLKLFSRGDLDQALIRWRAALELDPGNPRVLEYMAYVDEHRQTLDRGLLEAEEAETIPKSNVALGGTSATSEITRKAVLSAVDQTALAGDADGGPTFEGFGFDEDLVDDENETAENLTDTSKVERPERQDGITSDELTSDLGNSDELQDDELKAMLREPSTFGNRKALVEEAEEVEDDSKSSAHESKTGEHAGEADPYDFEHQPTPVMADMAMSPEPVIGEAASEEELEADAITPTSMRNITSGVIDMKGNDELEQALAEAEFGAIETTAGGLAGSEEASGDDSIENISMGDQESAAVEDSFARSRATASAIGVKEEDGGASFDDLISRVENRKARKRKSSGIEEHTAPLKSSDSSEQVEESVESMIEGAKQLYEQETYEGSAWLCERVLQQEPDNDAAKALLERNQGFLLKQYETQLGDLDRVPVVRSSQEQIVWHKLDHRAGFLLSRIDAVLSFNDILDISGMSRFEACRIFSQLLEQGVIGTD